MKYSNAKSLGRRPALTMIAAAVATMLSGQASAFKIDVGSPDAEVRWDNTVRYNVGVRMQERDNTLGDTFILQAGEYKFDKHDVVTNRVDLLSEFDFVYKQNYGFRVSGAAWYDAAYNKKVEGNPGYGGATVFPTNQFPNSIARYYTHSAEVLDAFAFGRVNFGDSPLDVKVGRHTVYWGESLFTPIHGVSFSQSPADFRKALATPGVEAKEIFLPLNQVSAHLQLNEAVSFAAQYQLEWKPFRLPEGGTYLSQGDFVFQGGTSLGPIPYNGDLQSGPGAIPKDRGNWGVMMKAAPEWMGGTLGVYYRKFDDKIPSILSPGGTFSSLYNGYAQDVKLAGVSFSKAIGGVSVGTELVHRQNTALNTNFGAGEIARGDSWHALANALAYIGKTPAFDSATLLAEVTYSKLDKVYGGSVANFNSCNGASKATGCSTKDAWGLSLAFTPTWFQALPSVDLTMPMSYSRGLRGNSPVPAGGNEGSGAWSVGLGADYQGKYKFDLAYNAYYGNYTTAPLAVPGLGATQMAANSGNGSLSDRGWLSFTFKTSF